MGMGERKDKRIAQPTQPKRLRAQDGAMRTFEAQVSLQLIRESRRRLQQVRVVCQRSLRLIEQAQVLIARGSPKP